MRGGGLGAGGAGAGGIVAARSGDDGSPSWLVDERQGEVSARKGGEGSDTPRRRTADRRALGRRWGGARRMVRGAPGATKKVREGKADSWTRALARMGCTLTLGSPTQSACRPNPAHSFFVLTAIQTSATVRSGRRGAVRTKDDEKGLQYPARPDWWRQGDSGECRVVRQRSPLRAFTGGPGEGDPGQVSVGDEPGQQFLSWFGLREETFL